MLIDGPDLPRVRTQRTKPSLPLPDEAPLEPNSDDSGGIHTPKFGITVVNGYWDHIIDKAMKQTTEVRNPKINETNL